MLVRQVKAARALLGWSQQDLARASGVSEPTIGRLEAADGVLGGRGETAEKIRGAFEKAGIEFIDDTRRGVGVLLRNSQRRFGQRSLPF
jgi:transcriptional regulator with XRE-family HTH domain